MIRYLIRHLLWVMLFGSSSYWKERIIRLDFAMQAGKPHIYLLLPHFTLVLIIFIGLFVHRHTALIYGLYIGLLHDFILLRKRCSVFTHLQWGLSVTWPGLSQRRQPNLVFYNLLIIGLGSVALLNSLIMG